MWIPPLHRWWWYVSVSFAYTTCRYLQNIIGQVRCSIWDGWYRKYCQAMRWTVMTRLLDKASEDNYHFMREFLQTQHQHCSILRSNHFCFKEEQLCAHQSIAHKYCTESRNPQTHSSVQSINYKKNDFRIPLFTKSPNKMNWCLVTKTTSSMCVLSRSKHSIIILMLGR